MLRPFLCTLFCLGLAFSSTIFLADVEDYVNDDFENDEILDELRFAPEAKMDGEKLGLLVHEYVTENWGPGGMGNLKTFNWMNCGGMAGGVVSASVSPDPIKTGDNVMIGADVSINMTLASPLKTAVEIRRQVGKLWVKLPCIDDFGSCTYDDVCELLEMIPSCPQPLVDHDIPCQCPYSARNYNLPASSFYIPEGPPPGNYNVTARIYDTNEKTLVCFSVVLSFAE